MLVPQPPLDMLVDKSAEFYITAALSVISTGGVLYGLYHWWRSGRPIVLLLLGAGGAMMIFEPLVDTVGGCWFPSNSYTAFSAYGRPMPIWLCEAYFFYFGIISALVWMGLRRGMSGRQIWLAFCAAMIGDLLFESLLLTVHPYAYYGHQPLLLDNGFAAWWMPVNALVPFVLGALIFRFDGYFRGAPALFIVPIGLTTSAAVNAGSGWPSWMAVNTDLGWMLTQIAGVSSFVLAGLGVMLMSHFCARKVGEHLPSPARRSSRFRSSVHAFSTQSQ